MAGSWIGGLGGGASAAGSSASTYTMSTGYQLPDLFGRNATGGYISGPGTGTSDSIPTMLSNGEYVINAKATKDNLALLSAINSGQIKKFASGGPVDNTPPSTAMSGATAKAAMRQTGLGVDKGSTQQVFNVHVTGDISRQTRREIQTMIPQIAAGVGRHNNDYGR